VRDWASLVPLSAVVAGISYLAYEKIQSAGVCPAKAQQVSLLCPSVIKFGWSHHVIVAPLY